MIEASDRPAGGGFSSPEVISGAGNDSFEPDVAIDAAGNAVAVWVESDGTFSIIEASVRPDGGGFGAADDLSEAGESAFGPLIAMTPGGSATAVWTRSDEDESFIQASNRPPGGSFSSSPEDVTPVGEASGPPDIDLAMNSAGDAVVAWPGQHLGRNPRLSRQRSAWARTASLIRRKSPPPAPTSSTRMPPSTARATRPWSGTDPTAPTQIAQAAGYDASPPEMRGLSIPSSGTVGVPVAFSASPFDVWPIALDHLQLRRRIKRRRDLGAAHLLAPGTYQVTATAVDAAGTPASAGAGRSRSRPLTSSRSAKQKRNRKKGTIDADDRRLRSRPGRGLGQEGEEEEQAGRRAPER